MTCLAPNQEQAADIRARDHEQTQRAGNQQLNDWPEIAANLVLERHGKSREVHRRSILALLSEPAGDGSEFGGRGFSRLSRCQKSRGEVAVTSGHLSFVELQRSPQLGGVGHVAGVVGRQSPRSRPRPSALRRQVPRGFGFRPRRDGRDDQSRRRPQGGAIAFPTSPSCRSLGRTIRDAEASRGRRGPLAVPGRTRRRVLPDETATPGGRRRGPWRYLWNQRGGVRALTSSQPSR